MAEQLRAKERKQAEMLLAMGADVYLHGPSGSGKSTLVHSVLGTCPSLWLNCSMVSSLKHVLRMLFYHYEPSTKKLSSPAQFQLQYLSIEAYKKATPLILVLDQADKLLAVDRTALHTLHRLRLDCGLKLTFVLISEVYPIEVFRLVQNVGIDFRPVPILVPGFKKEEIELILRLEYRPEDEERLTEFLGTVYPVFSVFSGHINMFRFVYEKLFVEFKQNPRAVFNEKMREMCDLLFDRREKPAASLAPESQFLAKLLAVASYLCSHSQSKSDIAAFKRLTTSKRSKARQSKYLPTAVQFPYERLSAVFQILHYDLCDCHFPDSVRLQATLGTLIEKKQVKASQPGLLQSMKLLSFVAQEEAMAFAQELGLKLKDYIEE